MPRKKALPGLPLSIDSYLGPVDVRLVDSVEKGTCLGRFLTSERLIELDRNQSLVQLWHTLFHEEWHLILWDTGGQLSKKAEEHSADVYATWRVREMLRVFKPY